MPPASESACQAGPLHLCCCLQRRCCPASCADSTGSSARLRPCTCACPPRLLLPPVQHLYADIPCRLASPDGSCLRCVGHREHIVAAVDASQLGIRSNSLSCSAASRLRHQSFSLGRYRSRSCWRGTIRVYVAPAVHRECTGARSSRRSSRSSSSSLLGFQRHLPPQAPVTPCWLRDTEAQVALLPWCSMPRHSSSSSSSTARRTDETVALIVLQLRIIEVCTRRNQPPPEGTESSKS
jgi:hypothetical protein